ncbi:MAG: nucleoside deaminase [Bacteroidota bacterium]|nr:nucleoside deaminase [Bacteroidota bacterium]
MTDEYFMMQAIKEAQNAFDADEVPIGAVIVMQNKIIARGYNQVEMLNDSTAHAEIIALTSAFNYLGSKYLPEATIYVTIEPCTMCCGALYWSKIARLVYGAADLKHGGLSDSSLAYSGKNKNPLHPKTSITSGIYAEECAGLLKSFFKSKR